MQQNVILIGALLNVMLTLKNTALRSRILLEEAKIACVRDIINQLRKNKKHGNKAKVAVARELCAFIWELAVKVVPALTEWQLRKAA